MGVSSPDPSRPHPHPASPSKGEGRIGPAAGSGHPPVRPSPSQGEVRWGSLPPIYPAYPPPINPCHHPPVLADNTRYRRSAGRRGRAAGGRLGGCVDAEHRPGGRERRGERGRAPRPVRSTAVPRGAARGVRRKSRSCEAASASSFFIHPQGRKPLPTVSPRRHPAGRRFGTSAGPLRPSRIANVSTVRGPGGGLSHPPALATPPVCPYRTASSGPPGQKACRGGL